MYARVHLAAIGTNVFLIKNDGQPLNQMEIGRLIRAKRVALFTGEETVDLGPDSFGGVEPFETDEIDSLVSYIKVFQREADVQRLVNKVQTHLQDPVQVDYALFFLTEPRLDILNQYTYTDTVVYVVKGEEVEKLGAYSTDEYEVGQILSMIDDQVELAKQE